MKVFRLRVRCGITGLLQRLRSEAVKTPPIMTPPLNSPSVLISFEKMKFRRGHFRAKPDPLLARLLT